MSYVANCLTPPRPNLILSTVDKNNYLVRLLALVKPWRQLSIGTGDVDVTWRGGRPNAAGASPWLHCCHDRNLVWTAVFSPTQEELTARAIPLHQIVRNLNLWSQLFFFPFLLYSFLSLLLLFFLSSLDRILHCPYWPRTCYVDQTRPKLT